MVIPIGEKARDHALLHQKWSSSVSSAPVRCKMFNFMQHRTSYGAALRGDPPRLCARDSSPSRSVRFISSVNAPASTATLCFRQRRPRLSRYRMTCAIVRGSDSAPSVMSLPVQRRRIGYLVPPLLRTLHLERIAALYSDAGRLVMVAANCFAFSGRWTMISLLVYCSMMRRMASISKFSPWVEYSDPNLFTQHSDLSRWLLPPST